MILITVTDMGFPQFDDKGVTTQLAESDEHPFCPVQTAFIPTKQLTKSENHILLVNP